MTHNLAKKGMNAYNCIKRHFFRFSNQYFFSKKCPELFFLIILFRTLPSNIFFPIFSSRNCPQKSFLSFFIRKVPRKNFFSRFPSQECPEIFFPPKFLSKNHSQNFNSIIFSRKNCLEDLSLEKLFQPVFFFVILQYDLRRE